MATVEELITENIDLWTGAIKRKSSVGRGKGSSKKIEIYGVKKLRELILEMAVRGLLVPQDTSDEPASVLLEKIAAERAKLVKDRELKKQKPSPAITEEDKAFPLRSGWSWCRWNEISKKIGDIDHKMPPVEQDGVPYVSPRDFYPNNVIDFLNAKKISQGDFERLALKIKPELGDIIFPRYGTIGETVLVETERDFLASYSCCVIKVFNQLISPKFQFYYSISGFVKQQCRKTEKKTTQANVGIKSIQEFVVPLPPLAEQHRIVAKVDELMALCDQLEQQTEANISAHQTLVETLLQAITRSDSSANSAESIELLFANFDSLFTTEESVDQLKQTILQLAVMGKLVPQDPSDEPASVLLEKIAAEKERLVKEKKIKKQKALPPIGDEEKPFELPVGWEWCNLSSLIVMMDAGWSPACPPEPSPNDETWGVLKTTAVQTLEYREFENKVLSASKEPRPQYEVEVGDILITRAGPKNRVAISCLVESTRPKLMISDKIIRFRLSNLGLSEKFVSLCLNSGATASYLEANKSGMAESQVNISQTKLHAAPIPVCPVNEQHRIIARVNQLMVICDELKAQLNTAQRMQLYLADAVTEQVID